jgi:hypothetical protein
MSVAMPAGFSTTTAVDVQIKALSSATVVASLGKPSASLSPVGSSIFDVKALTSSGTTLDSFSSALTITMWEFTHREIIAGDHRRADVFDIYS